MYRNRECHLLKCFKSFIVYFPPPVCMCMCSSHPHTDTPIILCQKSPSDWNGNFQKFILKTISLLQPSQMICLKLYRQANIWTIKISPLKQFIYQAVNRINTSSWGWRRKKQTFPKISIKKIGDRLADKKTDHW